jgi:hypothetical protein
MVCNDLFVARKGFIPLCTLMRGLEMNSFGLEVICDKVFVTDGSVLVAGESSFVSEP